MSALADQQREAVTLSHMLAGIRKATDAVADLRTKLRIAHKVRTGERGDSGSYVEDRVVVAVFDAINEVFADLDDRRKYLLADIEDQAERAAEAGPQ